MLIRHFKALLGTMFKALDHHVSVFVIAKSALLQSKFKYFGHQSVALLNVFLCVCVCVSIKWPIFKNNLLLLITLTA